MKNAALNWVRLPLEGVENCRELGGYSTERGEQVKWHAFLRSSDMHKLTEDDSSFLEAYGVKTVIDLRGTDEVEEHPNPLAEADFCDYHNIPFAGQPILEADALKDLTMGDFYVKMLEESPYVQVVFNIIDQSADGGFLFHCVAGKDRTGVLAMLLLGLAGVEKKDIISNYEVTYTNLESFHQFDKGGTTPFEVPKEFLYSSREYIIRAYDYLVEIYGDVEKYLLAKGVEQDVLDRVKGRLGQEAGIAPVVEWK